MPLPKNGKLVTFTHLYNPPADFETGYAHPGNRGTGKRHRITGQLKIAAPRTGMNVTGKVEIVRGTNTTRPTGWCSTRPDPVSWGDWIVTGPYRLHSRFRHAVNYVSGDQFLSIVDPSVGAGPLNIVFETLDGLSAETLKIGSAGLEFNGITLPLQPERQYDSVLALPESIDVRLLRANVLRLKSVLLPSAPPESLTFLLTSQADDPGANFELILRARFRQGVRSLEQGRLRDGIGLIKGLGRGLTPSGDDFTAGLLIAIHMRRVVYAENSAPTIETVYIAAWSENILSRSLLRCAKHGRVLEKLKRMIHALVSSRDGDLTDATDNLLKLGETSGADLATGLIIGLELPLLA